MRRSVGTSAVSVMGSHDGSVHHQPLVGVDTDTEETGIGVDLKDLVTGSQVVEDTSPVEKRERNEHFRIRFSKILVFKMSDFLLVGLHYISHTCIS